MTTTPPAAQGLYDPAFEHDACGVAFVVDMHGRRSHELVQQGVTALVHLDHRGASGAETNTGDGAGILIQVPDGFCRATAGVELPPAGRYATGIAFLPGTPEQVAEARAAIDAIVAEEGLEVLTWRDVPVDPSTLGSGALGAMPTFTQLFVAAPGAALEGLDWNMRVLFAASYRTRGRGKFASHPRAKVTRVPDTAHRHFAQPLGLPGDLYAVADPGVYRAHRALEQALQQNASKTAAPEQGRAITLMADETVPYEVIEKLIDLCKEQDYRQIAFAANLKAAPQGQP